MNVNHLAAGKISRGDVIAVARVRFDKADHQVQVFRGVEQLAKDRILRGWSMGDIGGDVLQNVTGQRKFGEDDQVRATLPGVMRQGQVFFEVGGNLAKLGIDLGESQGQFHR